MKLNVGCGEELIRRNGWLNIDLYNPLPGLLPIVEQDITSMPYEDNSVDEIVSSHSLEHLKNPLQALKEWYRVLKPGGVLIIAVPNNEKRSEWIGFHYTTMEQRKGREHLEEHHQDFTPKTLIELIEQSGEWDTIEIVNPKSCWEIPSKAEWQCVVRGVK